MTRGARMLFVVVMGGMLAAAAEARAARIVIPPRPGQVGLGVQGQYGALLKSGSVGESFGSGPGLAVRLRYRMRYQRGIGLSFESQRFDAREATWDGTEASIFTAGAEVYQMFGTRTRSTRMLSLGAGLAKLSVKLRDGETMFPYDDGVYVSAGAGVERFFWQSRAYDLSARYMTVFLGGKVNHDVHVALGLIFYAN